jgi:inhibitor of KinA sporulation pathway (predicted exonuclease)
MRHIFVDFEMCMVPRKAAPEPHMHFEIIQFGAVMLDERLNFIDEFSAFVKPQYGELTPEMTELTGITKEMLLGQGGFVKVFSAFLKWLGNDEYKIYSWSVNDLLQLKNETRIKKFPLKQSKIFENWIDFQKIFTRAARLPHNPSLGKALEMMQLEFVGSKHFADADAYNTARLFCICVSTKDFDVTLKNGVAEVSEREEKAEDKSDFGNTISDNMSADKLKQLLGF